LNLRPVISFWIGPESAPTQLPYGVTRDKVGVIPTTPGVTYYVKVDQDIGSIEPYEALSLRVALSPRLAAPVGSLLFNDDTPPFSALLMDPAAGMPLQFRNLVNGEFGAVLPSGILALSNDDMTADPVAVMIYSAALTLIATIPLVDNAGGLSIRDDGLDTFYVSQNHAAPNTDVRAISAAGVQQGAIWVVPNNAHAIAVDRLTNILYHTTTELANEPIRRFDLTTSLPLSNLVGGVGGREIGLDMFVLPNQNILATYGDGAQDWFIRLLSPGGATIRDFVFTPPPARIEGPRLALGADRTTFWAYAVGTIAGNKVGRFTEYRISDGVVLVTFDVNTFVAGVGPVGAGNDGDLPRFGNSPSCPFIVLPQIVLSPDASGTNPNMGEECVLEPVKAACWFPHDIGRQRIGLLG
jgi:hypothetical protein